ncbi:hypothetical protein HHK36_012777 [Tetracentron sinense]|uniref:Uncharacterized protein n=1 Tax=Tetracentron sinense TaxID=13715 RepID=A0A834Z9Q0_TETSI|nr:hypothetical protein HHK36_012777 [Tetracentron sinense]
MSDTILIGKQTWPELLRQPIDVAERTVLSENPNVKFVVVIENGKPRLHDINCNRVILYVTQQVTGIVIEIPRVQ